MQGFRRRTAEGSPKGRREGILADINARPPDDREPGNCRDRIATHSGRDGAGQEKKRKSPPRKKPPTKKEKPLLAAPLAYGRLRRPQPSHASSGLSLPRSRLPRFLWAAAPPSSLASFLSSFGGCAASFSCPLRASLASCGRLRRPSSLLLLSRFFRAAAPPYPFRFSSLLRRLRRLTLLRTLVGGWRRPPLSPLSFLSIKKLTNP